jgi:hypothetical protein
LVTHTEIGRIKFLSVCDQGMLPKSHSHLGRKGLGLPRQVPRHWQASLRQDLYLVVTSSVLRFPSASLLVVSQLECPVSFFGAASTSAPPYKADLGHLRHCPFWSPFTTRSSVRGWVFYFPPIPGDALPLNMGGPVRPALQSVCLQSKEHCHFFFFLALVDPIPSYA